MLLGLGWEQAVDMLGMEKLMNMLADKAPLHTFGIRYVDRGILLAVCSSGQMGGSK